MKKQLLPSLLSADFYQLSQEVKSLEEAGITHLHLDVMDGQFVPNLSFGPGFIQKLRPHCSLFFDTHLMVKEPDRLFPLFKKAGSDLLTVQAEACTHLHRTLQSIHRLGMKAGVAFNPATPLTALPYLLDQVDLVLIMSVNPGFGGQSFIPSAMKKLKEARQIIDQSQREIILEVDGGVKDQNLKEIKETGCDWFVAGSSVFQPDKTYENALCLKEILDASKA